MSAGRIRKRPNFAEVRGFPLLDPRAGRCSLRCILVPGTTGAHPLPRTGNSDLNLLSTAAAAALLCRQTVSGLAKNLHCIILYVIIYLGFMNILTHLRSSNSVSKYRHKLSAIARSLSLQMHAVVQVQTAVGASHICRAHVRLWTSASIP